MTAACLLTLCLLAASGGDADRSVEAGREALGHWHAFPWYNSSDDVLEPIDLPRPSRPGRSGGWTFPQGLLQWMAWMLLAVALAAVVVGLLKYGRRRALEAEQALAKADPATERRRVAALPLPFGRSHDNLLAEAARCYQEGNYREAVIYLFSHQLLELDRHHFIHLARGKTNRQYLRELGRATPLRAILDRTMVAFEDVFFGDRPLDRAGFEVCWADLSRFDALLADGALAVGAG